MLSRRLCETVADFILDYSNPEDFFFAIVFGRVTPERRARMVHTASVLETLTDDECRELRRTVAGILLAKEDGKAHELARVINNILVGDRNTINQTEQRRGL